MADIRSFRALFYDTAVAGDAATLIAPPYDVVSDAEREAMYLRGPFNISLVDYGETDPGDDEAFNRYSRAHADLEAWRKLGVVKRDRAPRLYVYDQEFRLNGEVRRRRAVFVRLRLEEWEKGIVLPHEETGAGAKEDRLRLLQATRTHLSPILALYRGADAPPITPDPVGTPIFDAELPNERHTLRPVNADVAQAFITGMKEEKLYVADGHHRYETALAYRDERRTAAASWTGDEPENFILAALVDVVDPGLIVLPTHRLLKLPNRAMDLTTRLSSLFEAEELGTLTDASLQQLATRLEAASGPAFGAIGLQEGRLHLLTPKDLDVAIAKTPAERADPWRRLDVTLLEHAVLPALGYDGSAEHIDYTEDHRAAAEAIASERWDVALLLRPTPVEQVIAVAEAGERMPRKSTYFYPKLATGVLLLPLE